MGRTHKKVLESIRLYISQMQEIEKKNGTGTEKGWLNYFIDSTYIAGNGQEQPCYNVTKIGCEFLAHKLKGVKGTEFTMRYIDRFHEMEEATINPKLPKTTLELLELHYQAIKEVDDKVNNVTTEVKSVKDELQEFKDSLPLLPEDADQISAEVKKRGVKLLGGKDAPAYQNRSLRATLYRDYYGNLKHNFNNITTYKAIKRSEKAKALEVVIKYEPPLFLKEQIMYENGQQMLDLEARAI